VISRGKKGKQRLILKPLSNSMEVALKMRAMNRLMRRKINMTVILNDFIS
jgi:hypothetical protein